jgi:hypothetical protein
MSDLQYPVGKIELKHGKTHEERRALIESISQTPARLRAAIANLSMKQLDEPYRPGGWTVRQVVHCLACATSVFLNKTLPSPPASKSKSSALIAW